MDTHLQHKQTNAVSKAAQALSVEQQLQQQQQTPTLIWFAGSASDQQNVAAENRQRQARLHQVCATMLFSRVRQGGAACCWPLGGATA
jgi:hypothetical protein